MIPLKIDKDLLSPQAVASRLSISLRTLWRLVERGDFPQPIRYTRKLVRWRTRDVEAWVEGFRTRPAS